MRWHAPSVREWAMIDAFAAAYDEQSSQAANTRRWNPRHNLIGLFGEWVYAEETGQPFRPRRVFGDGGYDFPGVDVKATPHWRSPRLLRLASDPLRAETFVLVAVDLERRRGYVVGSAPRHRLEAAPVAEYGYGPTRTLLARDLDPVGVRAAA